MLLWGHDTHKRQYPIEFYNHLYRVFPESLILMNELQQIHPLHAAS